MEVIRPVGFCVWIAMLCAACAETDPLIDASATDSVLVASQLETGPEVSPQVDASEADPFGDFGVDTNGAAATAQETPVWLVNQSRQPLIITARGGAATVVVDTVAASDSAFVRINTRALTVELSARTPGGVAMGTVVLPMDSEPRRAAFPH
ncbi:MAG: hypothetical protein WBN79_11630 [Gemmatimonadota bacterium]